MSTDKKNKQKADKEKQLDIKRYIKYATLGALVVIVVIASFVFVREYIKGLQSDISTEQHFQVEVNEDLKEAIIEKQELENLMEEIQLEAENQITNMEVEYKAELNKLESDLDNSLEYQNELEKMIHEIRYNVFQNVELKSVDVNEENLLIEEEHQVMLNNQLVAEFDQEHVLYYIIDHLIDGKWYYLAIELEDSYVVLVRCYLGNYDDYADKSEMVEIIHTFEVDNGYRGRLFKVNNDEIEYKIENVMTRIDASTGRYKYTISYEQYDEMVKARNGAMLSVDKNDTLTYSYMGLDKNLYYGFNEYTKLRGGGTVFVPFQLSTSLKGSFFSYELGFYEGVNGPYIVDQNGQVVYSTSKEDYSVSGRWISDTEYLDVQNVYNGSYIRIIDIENRLKTTLTEEQMDVIKGENGEVKGLIYSVYGEQNYVKIYTSNDYTTSIKINIDEVDNNMAIIVINKKMITSEVKDGKLIMKNYSFEYNDIQTEELKVTNFVTTEDYSKISGRLFLSNNLKDNLGSPKLFYLTSDHTNLIDISSLDDLNQSDLYMDYDVYNWGEILLFDRRIMVDERSGEIVGLDQLRQAVGSSDFDIIAAERGHDVYAYTVASHKNDYVEVAVYVSFESEEFKLVESFEISPTEYDEDDWKIDIPNGSSVYYDSINLDGERIINTYKDSIDEISLFMEGVKNPRTIIYSERVSVMDLVSGDYQLVSLQGEVLHTFPEAIKPLQYNSRDGLYYLTKENDKDECVITSMKGEEWMRVDTLGLKVSKVEKIDDYIRVYLIDWISKAEFEEFMIERKLDL